MDRREFFNRAALVGAVPVLSMVGVRDSYVPAGRITADSFEAMRVDYITLDGKRVDHAIECDDVEGWVRLYVDMDNKIGPITERRTGKVRVHWRYDE